MNDSRPKTAVLHQFAGIGDLVWMVPYFKAAAEKSQGGKVAVIASPKTFARDLLGQEPWVSEVIDFDRPRKGSASRKGRHAGILGLWRMARELRKRHFDRIYIFGGRPNRAIVAFLAGIPERYGFGAHWLQRPFVKKPYIQRYRGPSLNVYRDASSFAILHGLADHPIVPKLSIPEKLMETMRSRFSNLPRPLYALGIGTAQQHKQWGIDNFSELAKRLIDKGMGVLVVGGPAEKNDAETIRNSLPEHLRASFGALTDVTVLESAAALKISDVCVSNDTGVAQMAAACDTPTYIIMGPFPLVDHDPLINILQGAELKGISVNDVLRRLEETHAKGFE